MKLTKGQLKRIIKEELSALHEAETAGLSKSDAYSRFRDDLANAVIGAGVDDNERQFIINLVTALVGAAQQYALGSKQNAIQRLEQGIELLGAEPPPAGGTATPEAPGESAPGTP